MTDKKAPEQEFDGTENTFLARIQDWQNQKGRPVYTANVGDVILFFRGGVCDDAVQVPAICTRVERPGVLTIHTFPPQGSVTSKTAVQFDGMLSEADRKSQTVFDKGTWKFRPCDKIDKRHKEPWLDYCQLQIEQQENALAKYRRGKAERMERDQQLMQQMQEQTSGEP